MEGRSISASWCLMIGPACTPGRHGDRPRRYLLPGACSQRVRDRSPRGTRRELVRLDTSRGRFGTRRPRGSGSPAAKQYALPLNQAREIGRGGADSGASASPLFGAGIGNTRSHRSTVAANGTGPDARAGAGSGAEPRRLPRGGSSSNRSALASLDASHLDIAAHEGAGDGSLLALLGGAIAVLLLGGAGGVAMRRVRRSSSSL